MVDAIYGDPRLAQLYDTFDGSRDDLPWYLAVVDELQATSLVDVGCGTGSFAVLAAATGLHVVAVDPALASLEVARLKPGADRVRWVHGDATCLPALQVDLAVMTGNVAQVFLTGEDWSSALRGIRNALRPGGHLVLETRRPGFRAWEDWQRDPDRSSKHVPGVGTVEHWREVISLDLPLVSFRHTSSFPDGTCVSSDSTLRFTDQHELTAALRHAGYAVDEVRQAPDRPGAEFVVIARRAP